LDGGTDGLDLIINILRNAWKLVKVGGRIYLEVDLSHPDLLRKIIDEEFTRLYKVRLDSVVKDFTERERFCVFTVLDG
jgi:release factor glutamine methyltransferase